MGEYTDNEYRNSDEYFNENLVCDYLDKGKKSWKGVSLAIALIFLCYNSVSEHDRIEYKEDCGNLEKICKIGLYEMPADALSIYQPNLYINLP